MVSGVMLYVPLAVGSWGVMASRRISRAELAAVFAYPGVADAYQYRPPYPPEVFDVLKRITADRPRNVLDIGAGEGGSTRAPAGQPVRSRGRAGHLRGDGRCGMPAPGRPAAEPAMARRGCGDRRAGRPVRARDGRGQPALDRSEERRVGKEC